MSDDLVKRLSLLADSIELGDKLRWGEDSAALREAKDRIEELEAKLAEAEGSLNICSVSWGECNHILDETKAKLAQQDDLVQAAVAAALRQAAEDVRQWGSLYSGSEDVTDEVANDILALITEDAQAALDKMLAATRRTDRRQ